MNMNDLFFIILAGVIGLAIGYMLWGDSYSILNSRYHQLSQDYAQLNQSYTQLQQNYTKLQQDVKEVLVKYQNCVGRENFFEWISRVSSLFSLAKFLGII